MANAFFNFVTRFISGTTVKAGPINDRFTEVQTGFAAVETAVKSALKFAGYSTSTPITATPSTFLQINASGLPVASATLGFSPNIGAYRIQNVGNAAIGTDAPNYGQMTAYIATVAFGSPNVLVVPSFAGKSLKNLRLNVGETALEFGDQFSAPPTNDVTSLVSSPAGASWVKPRWNLLLNSNGWTVVAALPNTSLSYGDGDYKSRYCLTTNGTGVPRAVTTLVASITNTEVVVSNAIGSYVVSFSMVNSATVGGVQIEVVWLQSDGVTVVAAHSQNFSPDGLGLTTNWKRFQFSNTVTGAVYCTVNAYDLAGQNGILQIADVKIEAGTYATPNNYDTMLSLLASERGSYGFSGTYTPSGGGVSTSKLTLKQYALGNFRTTELKLEAHNTGVDKSISLVATRNNELTVSGRALVAAKLICYPLIYDNGSTGTAKTIDWHTNGAKQKATLNGNAAITLTALDSTIVIDGLRLMLQKDATATTFTPTFTSAATLKWKGNVIPESLTTASQEMEVIFWWDGARFVGSWAKI